MTIKKKIKYCLLCALALFLVFGTVAAVWYISDFYPASDKVASYIIDVPVEVVLSERKTAYIPKEPMAGLIFYPGGKVEHTAYEPLMKECAARGILCVLVEMPAKLAVLDMGAAAGIQETFPDVKDWYIGGHSLGGAMAASYLGSHADEFCGLILLGAYSTTDLRDTSLAVLSLVGSEDGVMDRQKYDLCRENLPSDWQEMILDGGNHAGFGLYGDQEGDGKSSLPGAEQVRITADAVAAFVKKTVQK